MPDSNPPLDPEEIRAAIAAVRSTDWHEDGDLIYGIYDASPDGIKAVCEPCGDTVEDARANSKFIANARQWLPALLSRVAELEAPLNTDLDEIRASFKAALEEKGQIHELRRNELVADGLALLARVAAVEAENEELKCELELWDEVMKRQSGEGLVSNPGEYPPMPTLEEIRARRIAALPHPAASGEEKRDG